MKKLNKFILGAASVAAIAAPIAATVSCGTKSLTDAEILALKPQSVSAESTVLVTDGGSIDDKSFNEQAAAALKAIRGKDITSSDFKEPSAHDSAAIVKGYQAVAAHGAKTILAPGFYHADAIKSFVKAHGNSQNFIIADSEVKAGNVASITFDTKQPGFLAGYLAANYASTHGRKVGTFGGGNFPGVTDFMTGFVAGIKHWNEEFKSDATKQIKFVGLGAKENYTNTGFEAGKLGSAAATTLVAGGASVILPVAGGETADVIGAITKASNANVKIVGVDTDQSISYGTAGNPSSLFLTSITKNISLALQAVYAKVSNVELPTGIAADSIKGFGETTLGTLTNKLVGIAGNHSEVASGTSVYTAATATATDAYSWDEAYNYISKNLAK